LAALPQPQVRVWVLRDNHRARRFYQRHGFHADGTVGDYRTSGSDTVYPQVRLTLHRP
jgi:ribosomal protein S18 acetylase RimI-like enzyme